MDRWAVIRHAAARVLADFEAKAQRSAFTVEAGSHACLAGIAARCFELTVTPDKSLDERRIGHLDDYLGITYWPGLTPERRDFTIAHEIAHKALDHPPRAEPDPTEDVDDLPAVSTLQGQSGVALAYHSRDRCELEANVFAAELLAPVALVRQVTADQPDWTLEGLAGYFGLSREAMANQITAALLPGPVECATQPAISDPPPLDDAQRAAAEVWESAALVIAGPGAGKTRVLTERYKHLVEDRGMEARHILALTYSNKAAEEMRERLERMLPQHAHEIVVSTFHALGLQLLTSYGQYIGLSARLRIASDVDAFVLLRTRLSRLELGHFEDLGYPTRNLRILLEAIKKAKNELMGPQEYADAVRGWRAEIEALPEPVHKADVADRRAQIEQVERFEDVARVYLQYQAWLHEEGLVDYGDLLMTSVRLFEGEAVTTDIHARYRHILVDEFQDINYASGRLIRELDGGRNVTWAVGDPRQSIFRFQGASIRNLSAFQNAFPGGRVLALQNNYRSVEQIVAAGAAVPFPGSEQRQHLFPATLTAYRGSASGPPAVRFVRAGTQQEEYTWIAGEIETLRSGGTPLGDIAILCRKREQAQAVSDYLEAWGIPTNWDGILQNNAVFKDVTAVIGLASDDPKALVRLAAMAEHALSEADLRILLRTAEKTKSLSNALYRARDGQIPELSKEGRTCAVCLLDLYFALFKRPTPWSMLTAYLFELSRWPRSVLHNDTPEGLRVRATLGQIADLVRGFRGREAVAAGRGAAAFLRYVSLAIESGRLETTSATPHLPNAVHVVTMHGSKGLQWPVVILPHQVEDTWKPNDGDLPFPRFLPRDKDPLDSDEVEEASLMYVALTRAQNQVLISSAKQGRFADREVPLHPLARDVHRALHARGLASAVELTGSTPEPATQQVGATDKVQPVTHLPFAFTDAVPHRQLETYNDCGLKFLYYYVYRLDDGENEFRLFCKVVRRVMRGIAEASTQGTVLSEEQIGAEFLRLWEKATAKEDTTSLYVQRGLQALRAFCGRLEPGEQVTIGYEATFLVDGRRVALMIDELRDDGSRWFVRKQHLSKPSARHGKDKFFLGLQLASKESTLRFPAVVLDYPLEERTQPVSLPTGDRVATHKRQLAATIKAIESGCFAAAPSAFKCRNCAFNLICPAS